MSDARNKLVHELNELAKSRFDVQLRIDAENQQFKNDKAALETAHAARLADLTKEADALDAQLWQKTDEPNRSLLIEAGKRSFITALTKFQFRDVPGKDKVGDSDGIMNAARRLGVVRQIANPVHYWKFDSKKFFAWLDKNGEIRPSFDEFIEEGTDGESLTIQPNSDYTVHFDNKRVSPPSISIKKPAPPAKDTENES